MDNKEQIIDEITSPQSRHLLEETEEPFQTNGASSNEVPAGLDR